MPPDYPRLPNIERQAKQRARRGISYDHSRGNSEECQNEGQADSRAGRRRGVERHSTRIKLQSIGRSHRASPEQGVKSLTNGSTTLAYVKNDPFRSWPISAKELVEVAMGSETSV